MKRTKEKYPEQVCRQCGLQAVEKCGKKALFESANYLSGVTFWQGKCDVCGKVGPVTSPRDYGYPEFAKNY